MTSYIMSRQCVTGATGYRFHRGSQLIGTASALVLPSFPIRISCGGLALEYSREPDITLVPGISIPILCGGKEWGRIFWEGQGSHRIVCPFGTVRAESRTDGYAFHRDRVCIANMHALRPGLPVSEDTWEPRFCMEAAKDLPEDLAGLLLAFPLLQIGI